MALGTLALAVQSHDFCDKDLIMDSQQKECHELSKQLAVYRAFNNQSAIAAIMRQMAVSHCPIGTPKHQ